MGLTAKGVVWVTLRWLMLRTPTGHLSGRSSSRSRSQLPSWAAWLSWDMGWVPSALLRCACPQPWALLSVGCWSGWVAGLAAEGNRGSNGPCMPPPARQAPWRLGHCATGAAPPRRPSSGSRASRLCPRASVSCIATSNRSASTRPSGCISRPRRPTWRRPRREALQTWHRDPVGLARRPRLVGSPILRQSVPLRLHA